MDSNEQEWAGEGPDMTPATAIVIMTAASEPLSARGRGPSSGKMNYACEACRLAKVKCQPGPTDPGICKRCSEFKRECIFRTGPRTRRSKYSQASTSAPLPPPAGPSKTFNINFDMPAEEQPDAQFDLLRTIHERSNFGLFDSSDDEDGDVGGGGDRQGHGARRKPPPSQSTAAVATFSFADMTTMPPRVGTGSPTAGSSTSSANTGVAGESKAPKLQSMGSLAIRPQFNLDSATGLLDHFRGMLVHCPVFVLPPQADVRSMAREHPFVLLAILAVSSCTTSLQGYSLYDEEFRKVLGLKFVAGGERTVEMLQGLLVYCAWYPFHLRPKSRHGTQYLRMAVDIVHDLELDQEDGMQIAAEDRLASIRAFLGCVYLEGIYATTWYKSRAFRTSTWWTKCGNVLEQSSNLYQDHVLVWLSRLQQVSSEINSQLYTARRSSGQDDDQRELIRLGLISRLRDLHNDMPSQYLTSPSVVLCSRFVDVYAVAGIAMRASGGKPTANNYRLLRPSEVLDTTHNVRGFLDFVANLTNGQVSSLCSADLGRIILVLIVASRLCFPMPKICPGLDYLQARSILQYDEYLEKLTAEPADDVGKAGDGGCSDGSSGGKQNAGIPSNSKTDVASALRVVLRSLKEAYTAKVAAHDAKRNAMEAAAAAASSSSNHHVDWSSLSSLAYQEERGRPDRVACPMINGTLDEYIAVWGGQPDQQYHSRFYQVQQPHPNTQPDMALHQDGSGVNLHDNDNNNSMSNGSSSMLSSDYPTSHSGQSSAAGMAPLPTTISASGFTSCGPSASPADGSHLGSGSGNDDSGQPGTARLLEPSQAAPVVFEDLWDAMTMGWADTDLAGIVDISQPQRQ